MSISNENKKINKILKEIFQTNPTYARYTDDIGKSTIDIMICNDSPLIGISSFGTLGLSDFSLGKRIDNVPLGVELVGYSNTKYEFFAKVLATCAFNVINSQFKCEPGAIHLNIINMYINTDMKHIMFVSPSGWEKKLETLYLYPQKVVAWLLIVPISDKEYEFSQMHGSESLENLFEKQEIDISNLERNSIF